MVKDPRINLHDISRFAREILTFSDGEDFESFSGDPLRIRAVSYCLLAIGEAVFRLERDFPGFLTQEVSPDVPWTQIIGTRNFLAHGYDRIDPGTLWKVIEDDLAPLLDSVEAALARLGSEE
jgi:uncharacterized protein with HEPN domain